MAPVCLPCLFFPGVRALNNLGVLPLLRVALQSVGWLLGVTSWGPCLLLGFSLWPSPAWASLGEGQEGCGPAGTPLGAIGVGFSIPSVD